jgi:hypothetical protein
LCDFFAFVVKKLEWLIFFRDTRDIKDMRDRRDNIDGKYFLDL